MVSVAVAGVGAHVEVATCPSAPKRITFLSPLSLTLDSLVHRAADGVGAFRRGQDSLPPRELHRRVDTLVCS
jgi:hypothetical protein